MNKCTLWEVGEIFETSTVFRGWRALWNGSAESNVISCQKMLVIIVCGRSVLLVQAMLLVVLAMVMYEWQII